MPSCGPLPVVAVRKPHLPDLKRGEVEDFKDHILVEFEA
jgi:hypothetical protein